MPCQEATNSSVSRACTALLLACATAYACAVLRSFWTQLLLLLVDAVHLQQLLPVWLLTDHTCQPAYRKQSFECLDVGVKVLKCGNVGVTAPLLQQTCGCVLQQIFQGDAFSAQIL